MRHLLALLALLFAGAAVGLQAPAELDVEPGRFVSIPVRSELDGDLVVTTPAGFTMVGTPVVQGGRALVNLLVASDVRAGAHPVRMQLGSDAARRATTTVLVAVRFGLDLRAPRERTVVAGDAIEYALELTNTGNAPDEFALEVRSLLPGGLDRDHVALEPGETVVLTLRLDAEGRRRDSARVTVTSRGDPSVHGYASIRTAIVPFAGADELDGPAQRYRLAIGAAYGSAGLTYRLSANAAGGLSDFVVSSARLELRDDFVYGQAAVQGDDWRVGYRGSTSLQRFEARTGPYQAHLALIDEGYSLGGSFADGPWRVTLAHEQRERDRQSLGVGYTAWPLPEFALTPTLNVIRAPRDGAGDLSLELGLDARAQTEAVVAAARFSLPVPVDRPWRLGATISSRSQSPFGVRAEAFAEPRRFGVTVATHQEVTQELTLRQRVSYSTNLSFSVGARYRPLATPWTVTSSLGGFWRAGVFNPSGSASVRYAPRPWDVGIGVSYVGDLASSMTVRYRLAPWTIDAGVSYRDGFGYGATVEYDHEFATVTMAYRFDADDHVIGAVVRGDVERWEPRLGYAYDLRAQLHLFELGTAYTFAQGHGLWGNVSFGETFAWSIGGTLVLQGGFETPDAVVEVFGGRAVGFVQGVVFHDVRRDGEPGTGASGLAGLVVRAAGNEVVTDGEGRFRLPVAPGTHRVTVGRLPADLGLTRTLDITVDMGQTVSLDVPLETVVSVTGVVFDDAGRSGTFTAAAKRVAYARVVLDGPGTSLTTYTDDRGEFFFQSLVPGPYTLSLDPATLPRFYEPTTGAVSVTLATGPTPRVHLGAAERPREVRRTLGVGDLSMIASATPSTAPPGADIRIVAQVQGAPDQVVARLGEIDTPLVPTPDGRSFEGYVSVPDTAVAIVAIEVAARRGDAEATQRLLVPVRAGPLATVRASSGLVAPGETMTVRAEFLVRVADAYIVVADERHPLEHDGPYAFSGAFVAPDEAGSHEIELWADGERYAITAFRVSE